VRQPRFSKNCRAMEEEEEEEEEVLEMIIQLKNCYQIYFP
jgi:hypothetical protein